MAKDTLKYKRSISNSIGAGIKSVFGNEGRRYYILEHKVSSKYHKAGENQKIIVDQIEIGRSDTCQVRFDDTFETVSRKHAAIVRDGDNWKLVPLSNTNSTYLNGVKIKDSWYLQNGDEIQLSTNGPRLGFIVPNGDKSMVKSLGLSVRLELFRKQALRPYKQAMVVICCILFVLLSAGVYTVNEHRKIIAQQEELLTIEKQRADSIVNQLMVSTAELDRMKEKVRQIEERPVPEVVVNSGDIDNGAIESCLPYVFYIETVKVEVTAPNGDRYVLNCGDGEDDASSWSGTGFLLSDGRFVTARHVIEGWNFWLNGGTPNTKLLYLNVIAHNGGKVVYHFVAKSSSGKMLTFKSDQFNVDRSSDKILYGENGLRYTVPELNNTDYAYMQSSGTGLAFDSQKSENLERGAKLTVLGFPLGLGVNSNGQVNPVYGSAVFAVPGLHNGVIATTDTNYESGNSGGPVFYTDSSGNLKVIGIVSAGAGRNIGFIVPLSVIN